MVKKTDEQTVVVERARQGCGSYEKSLVQGSSNSKPKIDKAPEKEEVEESVLLRG